MAKRARPTSEIPTLVAERLKIWGKCIRKQRVLQKMTAHDLVRAWTFLVLPW